MSSHQSKPIIVIVCPESGDEREGVRGRQVTLPLTARRGGAKHLSCLLKRGTKRTGTIAPVKNSGRSFKATGWLTIGTARGIAGKHGLRFVPEIVHFNSPLASASCSQIDRSDECAGEKSFPATEKGFPRTP